LKESNEIKKMILSGIKLSQRD